MRVIGIVTFVLSVLAGASAFYTTAIRVGLPLFASGREGTLLGVLLTIEGVALLISLPIIGYVLAHMVEER